MISDWEIQLEEQAGRQTRAPRLINQFQDPFCPGVLTLVVDLCLAACQPCNIRQAWIQAGSLLFP